jgi:WD40 repeat protein
MKYHLNLFIAAHFLCAAISCAAMETHSKKPDILMELTCIEKPLQAIFLTEDCAVIRNANKCSFVNVATNTEIKKIWDNPNPVYYTGIEVHPDKTKIAFLYHTKTNCGRPKIAIYNAHTGAKEWSKKTGGGSITSASFSRLDDTIATCESCDTIVKIHNYTTNETVIFDINNKDNHTGDMTDTMAKFHPTMPLMCIARNNLYTIDLTTLLPIDCHNGRISHKYDRLCQYSSDGSYRATYSYPTIYIDTLYNAKIIHTEKITSHNLCNMVFHPHCSVLALALKPKSILQYWDIRKKKLIHESPPLLNEDIYDYHYTYLSFSPNGTKLMFTYEKCIILPVPFEAIYECDTKKRFPYLLFLLRNIDHNQTERLPQEIIAIFINNLFGAFKR